MGAGFDLKIREHIGLPGKKRLYNERHFSVAAPRYDLATRAMSLGRDAAWKRLLVASLPPLDTPVCVDMACGTGDVAFLLAARFPRGTVAGADLAGPMLEIARERNGRGKVMFLRQDMGAAAFRDGSVDIVTGAYALRNAPDLGPTLREIRRILRPGGAAAFLDFAKPKAKVLQRPLCRLLAAWCGLWGLVLHGSAEIHGSIGTSLAAFPDRALLRRLFRECGFEVLSSRRFFGGVTELLVLRRT